MLRVTNTEKISFEEVKGIKKGFYLKGEKYIYYSRIKSSKYKSVELLADQLVKTNSIFVWDDIENSGIIYIIYCNQGKNTIKIEIPKNDLEDFTEESVNSFNWGQFNAILKWSILYASNKDIYVLENSKINDKIIIDCNIKVINQKKFLKAYNKAYTLKSQKFYILRSSAIIISLCLLIIGIELINENIINNHKNIIDNKKKIIVDKKQEYKDQIKLLTKELNQKSTISTDLKKDLERLNDAN